MSSYFEGITILTNSILNVRFTLLKVAAIKELKTENPNGRFWIKLDGTDVTAGIMQSKRKVWNGDVDHDNDPP